MPMLFPKSREDWLNLRRGYVSSTESACLFGMSPYITAFELAVDKKSEEAPAAWEGNERTTWGLRLQRVIAEGIAKDYGVKVRALTGYATLDNCRMGASFDYEIVGVKDDWTGTDPVLREYYQAEGPGILEVKNVDKFVFNDEWIKQENKTYDPPAHIEMQVQHQLECCGRAWACVAALVGGNRQVIVIRMRDPEVGAAIRKKVDAFYKLIESGGMPPLDLPTDADAVKHLYYLAEPGSLLDYQGKQRDERIAKLALDHVAATAAKKAAEDKAKETGALLLFAIGTAEKVLFDEMTVSAGTTGPSHIEAYDRAGYRNMRVFVKKRKDEIKEKSHV